MLKVSFNFISFSRFGASDAWMQQKKKNKTEIVDSKFIRYSLLWHKKWEWFFPLFVLSSDAFGINVIVKRHEINNKILVEVKISSKPHPVRVFVVFVFKTEFTRQ